MKKIISVFLSFMFVFGFCFNAYARNDNAPIPAKTLNEITDDFRKALKSGETSVPISKYGIYDNDNGVTRFYLRNSLSYMAIDILSYTFGKNPENIVVVGINNDSSGLMSEITITYPERYMLDNGKCDLQKIAADKKIVSSRYTNAKNMVKKSMTDLEKALVLYDYIVGIVAYAEPDDTDISGNDTFSTYSYMIAGLLLDRRGVCAAYAKLYASLLNDVGVPAITVSSDEIDHEWVMVCIDGEWYHCDPTWDDPVYTQGYTAYYDENDDTVDEGAVTHYYFLKSDDEIKELEHPNWEVSMTVNPDLLLEAPRSGPSGKFDGMFFDSNNEKYLTVSSMCFINGYWYFTDLNTKAVIRTTIDGEPETITIPAEREYPKYTFGYNDCLYISTNESVYRFDTFTDRFTRILGIPSEELDTSHFSEMNISFGEMKLITITYNDANDTPLFITNTYQMDDLEIKEAVPDHLSNGEGDETVSRNDEDDSNKPAYTKPGNINNKPSSSADASDVKSSDSKSSSFDPIYIIISAGVVVLVVAGVIIIKRIRR